MFALPDLPYARDALEPVLSGQLMGIHHDKHHAAYVDNVNRMLAEAGRAPRNLEEVVRQAWSEKATKLFNNAGQAWNHAFFWECMSPDETSVDGQLSEAVDRCFGGLEQLKARFVEEGAGHFGSGWVWLAARGGDLSVTSTHDGDTLITEEGVTPILVCDVWEHAYYLDYKQDRKGFLQAWFDRLADWRFAGGQYSEALGQGAGFRYPPPRA